MKPARLPGPIRDLMLHRRVDERISRGEAPTASRTRRDRRNGVTIGAWLRARIDGSIQSFHVAFGPWSHHRFPYGHPYALATTAGQMHHHFPDRYEAGSDRIVLTPIGESSVENGINR